MSNGPSTRPTPTLWALLDWVMAFAAVAIVGIVMYQIFARAATASIGWTEELARLVCIWAVFLGMPALLMRRSLIRIEFFFDHLPLAVRRVLLVLEYALTAALLALMGGLTLNQAAQTWDQTSPGLVWPMGIFTLPIALGAGLGLYVQFRMRRTLLAPGPAHDLDDEIAKDAA